jgi:cell division protein FtsB
VIDASVPSAAVSSPVTQSTTTVFRRYAQHGRSRRPSAQILVLLFCAALTSYFAYHAIRGRHGLGARTHLAAQRVALSAEIERLEAVRRRLDHESSLLASERPDPDFLGEIAVSLGFASPSHRLFGDQLRNDANR